MLLSLTSIMIFASVFFYSLHMAFEALDVNHTSLLDADTIRKALGEDVLIEDVEEMLKEMGESIDGKIGYGKFLQYWREMMLKMNVQVPMRHYYAAVKESVVSNVLNPIGNVMSMLSTIGGNGGRRSDEDHNQADCMREAETNYHGHEHNHGHPSDQNFVGKPDHFEHNHNHNHSHYHNHDNR